MLARTRFGLSFVLLVLLSTVGCHGGHHHNNVPTSTPTSPSGATATATRTTGAATATATPTTASSTASATPTVTPTIDPSCPIGPVDTTVGVLCGTTETIGSTMVHAFLGVHFAESTGGENRWEPPVPKGRATERIQATHFGDICPQVQDNPLPLPPQSENCLSLNVWVPAGTPENAKLPVMVFVYGGSFLNGASAIPIYDGAYLSATQNVVLVTLNYRVGALGFLAGIHELKGNFGLLDQQLALKWVQDNIGKFGGDKSKVLLFGESAGAMSVGLHLLSIPSSEGLFESALMESNPLSLPYKTVEQAHQTGQCLQEMLECTDLACMRSKPFEQIVSYQTDSQILLEGLLNGFAGFLVWAPAIDGTLFTQQPFADIGSGLPKPTLIGTNLDEGTLFVYSALAALGLTEVTEAEYKLLLGLLFTEADQQMILQAYPPVSGDNAPVLSQVATDYIFFCSSRHLAAAGVSPVFAYQFTQVSSFNIWPDVPQCADQVCHASEVPYVFHTATNIGATFTPEEEALSQAMASYWGGFSRPGSNPNTGGMSRPNWPAFPGFNYLDLGTPISAVVDPPHNCSLWDEIGYETVAVGGVIEATCVPPKTPTPTPTP